MLSIVLSNARLLPLSSLPRCGLPHSCVRHDSLCVRVDLFVGVWWLICVFDLPYACVWYDLCVSCDPWLCVTRFMGVCDLTYGCV